MCFKYYFSIIFLLICIMSVSCSAQKNGYIVTNTNDTIKGNFKLTISSALSPDSTPMTVFTVYSENTKTNIKLSNISKINVVKRKKVTATYIISDNDFWQLLVAKGNIGIYKRNYNVSECGYVNSPSSDIYYGDTLCYKHKYEDISIFLKNEQIEQIYNNARNDYSYIKSETLRFINTRYKIRLTKWKDIKSQNKLFDFILDKEVELEQQGK